LRGQPLTKKDIQKCAKRDLIPDEVKMPKSAFEKTSKYQSKRSYYHAKPTPDVKEPSSVYCENA